MKLIGSLIWALKPGEKGAPGSLDRVFFDVFVTSSVCPCVCIQSEHHLGPSAQAETDRPVFSHSDAGSGEAGESRTQESSPHHRQGEGCGCLCHPENTLQTLQLLHCESAGCVTSVWLRKETIALLCSVRSAGQRTNSTAWWRFWGSTSMRRTWSFSGVWNMTDASGNENEYASTCQTCPNQPRSNALPSPPQHVCMRGILCSRAGDPGEEGERLLHPRQDERQTQQDLRWLSEPEKVTHRLHLLFAELKSSLTFTLSVSQWNPGVHRCDGQRHRHTWCELGAAVRPSQQCQVRAPNLCVEASYLQTCSAAVSLSQRLRSSMWAYGTYRQSGERSRLSAPHGGVLRQFFVHQPESEYFVRAYLNLLVWRDYWKVMLLCFLQCPLQKMPPVNDVVDVLPKVKAMSLADRAMFDRSMRAFVSYVQAYAKHECSLIFRVKGQHFCSCMLGFWHEFSLNTARFFF